MEAPIASATRGDAPLGPPTASRLAARRGSGSVSEQRLLAPRPGTDLQPRLDRLTELSGMSCPSSSSFAGGGGLPTGNDGVDADADGPAQLQLPTEARRIDRLLTEAAMQEATWNATEPFSSVPHCSCRAVEVRPAQEAVTTADAAMGEGHAGSAAVAAAVPGASPIFCFEAAWKARAAGAYPRALRILSRGLRLHPVSKIHAALCFATASCLR